MKIAINGRFLALPYVGIGQHMRYILRGLCEVLADASNEQLNGIEICIFVPTALSAHMEKEVRVLLPRNTTIEVLPEKRGGKQRWEQWQLGKAADAWGADALWLPYPCLVRTFSRRIVVTIHDLIPWQLKEYRRGLTAKLAQHWALQGVRCADALCAVSHSAMKDIASFIGREEAEISLTANGISEEFFTRVVDEHAVLELYGLHAPYCIYLGGYDRRKCAAGLVQSFDGARAHFDGLSLGLVGDVSHKSSLYVSPYDLSFGRDHVMPLGFIPEHHLRILLTHAHALVHASVAEGFNIPLLAAQVAGCPVIARDLAVNNEIAVAGIFGDVTDSDFLAGALARAHTERDELAAFGKAHAQSYVAAASAKNLLDTLLSV